MSCDEQLKEEMELVEMINDHIIIIIAAVVIAVLVMKRWPLSY